MAKKKSKKKVSKAQQIAKLRKKIASLEGASHGGARPGAGRKTRYTEALVSHTLSFPPTFWKAIDDMGSPRADVIVEALRRPTKAKKLVRVLDQLSR